ncbi:MAG: 2,3-bisphosphoglycerate-independent phosphoglycerate mutase [Ktedonobacterales bacterium]|jgi:2,3-bisphosphoglycerate-independent phosphoglycerate mutase|nr:MAG: 2,3-bisphosphoglycerate-independent phosphoglycerate mutase [Ktedonobacterales bacterium]
MPVVPRPLVLIVMDGYGINPRSDANAIALARKPHLDRIARDWPHTQLQTSGPAVGLPEGQMGNSEVGHLNIGAGKRVLQEYTRVTAAIHDGTFFENPALLKAIEHVKRNGSKLHFCGLLGPGGVHAHQSHLEALLRLAANHEIEQVYIHAFTDGRDTSPTGAKEYMTELLARAAEINPDHPARVATISGRYYAMDRDNRWERIARVYWAMTRGEGVRAENPVKAIGDSYDHKVTDEFIEPVVLMDGDLPVATVEAGDSVIYYNFRSDRGRELTKAFALPEMPHQAEGKFARGPRLYDLVFVTMTEYETGLPVDVAFPADNVDRPIARILADHGMKQFHTAETEKYAHVTFFFNGGREAPFAGEDRLLVPSPKVPTYDLKPEMSSVELTDEAVRRIESGIYDVVVMNYANADMVGHTGVLEAAIKAVEAVDAGVGRVVEAALARGGAALITADHGNAEQMIEYDTGKPLTAHTTNPVPFYFVVPQWQSAALRHDGILADVAPTMLQLLNIPQPATMSGKSLIVSKA